MARERAIFFLPRNHPVPRVVNNPEDIGEHYA